jgi:uncharacterized repeat protein (TIGR01451 family)
MTQRRLRVGVVALSFFFALAMLPGAASAYGPELRRYPYLTDVVESSATVNWATDQSSTTALVRWGEVDDGSCATNSTPAARQAITVGSDAQYQWRARLAVSPDREYCYRVYLGSSPEVDLLGDDPSPRFFSQLPAGSKKPFSFIVLGDWGELDAGGQNPDMARVMGQIARSGARFAVTTGDNTHPGSSQTLYGDLLQTGPDTSAVFGPEFWKVPGASLPAFPALGNHGFATAGAYFTNWNQREAITSSGGRYTNETYCCLNGTSIGSFGSAWYAFDAGNTRLYVLEAAWSDLNPGIASVYQNDYDYHWAPDSAQYQWLQADLASHPSQHKFAFFHYPIYSDQASQSSDTFLQSAHPPQPPSSLEGLLSANGVDIAFSGHAHTYQRNFKPHANSLVTYVNGGGGAHLQTIGANGCSAVDAYGIGWSMTREQGSACGAAPVPTSKAEVFHFLKVSVNGTQVTVTPTDSMGRTFDVATYTGSGPVADLSLSAPDTAIRVLRGQTLTWRATVRNSGPANATDVTLFDTLPPGVSYQSATPSQGSCANTWGTVSCDLGGLAAGESAVVDLKVTADSEGMIANTASVQGAQSDPTADNTFTQATNVDPAADLSLGMSASPDPVSIGDALTYTLAVTNGGPSSATNVTLADSVPVGTRIESATPSQGNCTETAPTISCDLGGLASGESAAVELEVVALSAGVITNTATVAASEADPTSEDNEATVSATALDRTPPDVSIDAVGETMLGTSDAGTDLIWHADENGSFSVRVGGSSCATGTEVATGTYMSSPSELTATVDAHQLAEGDNTIRVCVADASGNVGVDAAAVTRDTTAPPVSIGAVSDYLLGASDPSTSLSWHASEDGSYSVRVGGSSCATGTEIASGDYTSSPSERTSAVGADSLADGANTIRVCVTDGAGNAGADATRIAKDATLPPPTTTLTVMPEADARVEEATRSTNYGSSTTLRVDGGSDPDVESYLRFRVSGVTGPIQSAKLRLYATSGTANGPAAYKTGSSWSETGISWGNRAARTSGATDDKGSIGSGAWVEYDVKPLVSGDGTHSFVLATSSTDGVDFHSREASDSTRRPRLVVTYAGSTGGALSASAGLTAQAASLARLELASVVEVRASWG